MGAAVVGTKEAAPDLRFRAAAAGDDAMNPFLRDPADIGGASRLETNAALKHMRIIAGQEDDFAGADGRRRHALDLDHHLARSDVMIADQLFGGREEWREMLLRELGVHAEIAGQLGVDDHSARQAQRAENVRQNVHWKPESGVSVNLSGSPIILANRGFT